MDKFLIVGVGTDTYPYIEGDSLGVSTEFVDKSSIFVENLCISLCIT